MEKRLLGFLWVSVAVVIGFTMVQRAVLGPRFAQPAKDVQEHQDEDIDPAEAAGGRDAEEAVREESSVVDAADTDPVPLEESAPSQRVTLGSLDPKSGFNMLVTLSSQGAAVERIELNSPRYRELEAEGGYLGSLALEDDPDGGCRVLVVGAGTPASLAESTDFSELGLRAPEFNAEGTLPGDRIATFNDEVCENADDFWRRLALTRPGQEIVLGVERSVANGDSRQGEFRVHLESHPLQLVRPELDSPALSFLLSFHEIGNRKVPLGQAELARLPSLRLENWSVQQLPEQANDVGPGVEFRFQLSESDLKQAGLTGAWEVVKRYRLAKHQDDVGDLTPASGYRLVLEMELINRGAESQNVAYLFDGPCGLTDEGWWYSYKVHPRRFAAAGARDIAWRTVGDRHELFLCPEITQYAKKNPKSPDKSMIDAGDAPVEMQYVGSDAQYFLVAMLPNPGVEAADPFFGDQPYRFQEARAHVIGTPDPKVARRTNVTYRLISETAEIAPGDALRQRYTIFAGPKDPRILTPLGLQESIVFGWFKVVARPMVGLLNILYRFSGSLSYGIAIILLTVMVRGLMFPFGRQMAMNAQKMQELAPEMKRLAEKYSDDLQKRGEAQRELFRKHNYNPFGGCVVLIFQLPVFVGLYRALSVDIELRQAPLIPGLSWCSNLAGPDKLLNWETFLPAFLSSRSGWLGPYLNILPILSIVLMLVHQKMFTPPPQDEQQKSQQTIMKYMMIFFGVMFHKIAAGLCIYFIASSIWGLAERYMLPKKKGAPSMIDQGATLAAASTNGTTSTATRRKLKRKGRK